MSEKRVGDLNGPWAVLFKLGLVLLPIFITGAISNAGWAMSRIFDHESRLHSIEGSRFSDKDGKSLEMKLTGDIAALGASPPKWFADKVEKLEETQARMIQALDALKVDMEILKRRP